ncbi:MAG: hypothetical protein ACYT04_86790, partial [Nostoc sp.]
DESPFWEIFHHGQNGFMGDVIKKAFKTQENSAIPFGQGLSFHPLSDSLQIGILLFLSSFALQGVRSSLPWTY